MDGDDDVALVRAYAGDEDAAGILIDFNGRHMAVSVFARGPSDAGQLAPSPELHLVRLVNQLAAEGMDDDALDDLTDTIVDVLLDAGRDLFRLVAPVQAAPERSGGDAVPLHSLLFPEKHHFVLRGDSAGGRPRLVATSADDAYVGDELPTEYDHDYDGDDGQVLRACLAALPRYTTKEVQVVEAIMLNGSVSRVQVSRGGGNAVHGAADFLCKATDDSALATCSKLRRELACLATLLRETGARLASAATAAMPVIRTPPLVGLVTHPDNGCAVGFLRQWVPSERLSDVLERAPPSAAQKQQWATQIRQSVDGLHRLGLVWGDGKTSNVIVGNDGGGAWLVDFGGGYTDGWVDRDKEDTVEGDNQAVDNIFNALGITTYGG